MPIDCLYEMFKQQQELQERLGYDLSSLTMEERVSYIKEYTMHMDHEVHEMLQELPFFKPWKKYEDADHTQMLSQARMEWIDVTHFFLNVSLALGFTPYELFLMYNAKNQVNHERQDNTEEYKPCVEDNG
jgi:dimeric dUTPase (all-alpha-NTP-PPase superfamily)